LMAKEGLNQLSMHKLAKEANIAAGTICSSCVCYVYGDA
jgi:glutamate 5-kinase